MKVGSLVHTSQIRGIILPFVWMCLSRILVPVIGIGYICSLSSKLILLPGLDGILLGIEQCHFAFAGCAVPRINEKLFRTFLSGKRGQFSRTFWPWTFMISAKLWDLATERVCLRSQKKIQSKLTLVLFEPSTSCGGFWSHAMYHRAKEELVTMVLLTVSHGRNKNESHKSGNISCISSDLIFMTGIEWKDGKLCPASRLEYLPRLGLNRTKCASRLNNLN